jgi:ATP-binding cassette subfamily B protein
MNTRLVPSIWENLKIIWLDFSVRRRRQFFFISLLMIFSAFSEVVSLGALIPFLAVLIDPASLFSHPLVEKIAHHYHINSAESLVLPLTVLFVSAVIFAGLIRLFQLWVSVRLTHSVGVDLSVKVYRNILYQPYRAHLARNSSEVISDVYGGINSVVSGVLFQVLVIISSLVLLMSVLVTLIFLNPKIALISITAFGGSYIFVSLFVRFRLRNNSFLIASNQRRVVKLIQESIGGIRDLILDNTQPSYIKEYSHADQRLRYSQANNVFIAGSPRFFMETLGIVFIALLAYNPGQNKSDFSELLPMLGALALGAQRLLPAMQNIYAAWASIAASKSPLNSVVELLKLTPPNTSDLNHKPIKFNKSICFKNVSFRYETSGPQVLDDLNFEIIKGMKVGLVGRTGSGKSTILDVLIGLLEPNEGQLLVDEENINNQNRNSWQKLIAHVPQNIFLADATIAENIAFGVALKDIDMDLVRKAAIDAQIADFIETKADGYNAMVGERGIWLSGGQKQRIGIARAIYKQASILVFDEATSALDGATEKSLMEAIDNLSRDLTVIIVAHRLNTVKGCDVIFELQDGKIVSYGSYDALVSQSTALI